jgi:hypothetical protein
MEIETPSGEGHLSGIEGLSDLMAGQRHGGPRHRATAVVASPGLQ